MKTNFRFMSVALAFILCFAAVGFGQGTTGSIEGTVSDSNGAAIPNATVKVQSSGSTAGFNVTVTANSEGFYSIPRVAPGTYKLTVTAGNFKERTVEATVGVDSRASVNVTLEPGTGVTTVEVIADSNTTVDQTDTKVATSISKQLIEDLPSGTTFSSLLKIAPNVRPEAQTQGFQIDGASGAENVFVIDGQEVTNFRTGNLDSNFNLPFELVQEVQVKSTGYEAEYGGATGGVINVVTVGGNDSWRGAFGIGFQPAKMQGGPRGILTAFTANAISNTPGNTYYYTPNKDGGTNFFPSATFSGPIVKGKLWFSAVYAPQIFDTTRVVDYYSFPNGSNNPSGRTTTESIEYNQHFVQEDAFIRLDAQPHSRLRMYGTFLWNPIIQESVLPGVTEGFGGVQSVNFGGSIGTLRGADLLGRQGGRQNANAINGQVTWNPTNYLIINGRAGRSFLNEKTNSYFLPNVTRYVCSALGPQTAATTGCAQGFQNVANNSQVAYDVSTRTTYDVDATFTGINFGGRHSIKFGFQLNKLFNTVDRGYKNLGIIQMFYDRDITALAGVAATPGNLGSGLMTRFGTVGEASSDNKALFVQDTWQIANRVTINAGVRIENEIVPNFGTTGSNAIKFGWGDKISPRIGVAFDVTGDGKNKIYANWGQFYDRFKYELPRGSFGGDFFRRDYFEVLPTNLGGVGLNYLSYTRANILGSFSDPIGGQCPITAPTGLSRCQFDFRIATNLAGADIFETGAIDPNIKAARQSEYTVGYDRQLGSNFLMSARYTHKNVDRAIEDVGVFNSQGSEAYIIGNPGLGLVCDIATTANLPCAKAERKYDAVEVRLDKRATKYFFNASYTWSRLFGNYSGLASTDEIRSSPNVNRFFDLPPLGFTADGDPDNGLLATDRPHVFKAYGGYRFNWNSTNTNVTTVSAFTSIQSGTPLTTIYNLYSLGTTILNGRGDLGRTESFTETDLSISHRYKFGRDNRFTLEPYLDIRNLFDEKNVLGLQTNISAANFTAATLSTAQAGCTTCGSEAAVFQTIFNGVGIRNFVRNYISSSVTALSSRTLNTYGQANSFQGPRNVRFGFRMSF
ncbi:MAG: TonB-dependent receptor [Acidobacteria bacterium]|nr:TonB-dependent receptor [Acidobacteriota bacterium]MBK8809884.1 TonB-dependent receptor [Acidobacteriota bacterium]